MGLYFFCEFEDVKSTMKSHNAHREWKWPFPACGQSGKFAPPFGRPCRAGSRSDVIISILVNFFKYGWLKQKLRMHIYCTVEFYRERLGGGPYICEGEFYNSRSRSFNSSPSHFGWFLLFVLLLNRSKILMRILNR
jgi:hypothetical protein